MTRSRNDSASDRNISGLAPTSRRALLAGSALAALTSGGIAEASAESAAAGASVQVSPQMVESGRSAQVTGSGYPAKQIGGIYWDKSDTRIGEAKTNKKGQFKSRVEIPAGLRSGSYRLTVRFGKVKRTAQVQVVAAPEPIDPEPSGTRSRGIWHPNMPENPV
ncbi:MAG: hypothetical protein ACR2J8_05615, partial [Thermomicrobiales bacterium]